jgi:hypothetical protein
MLERELPPSYHVDRSEDFIRQFNDLRKHYSRLGDLMDSIDWALARRPHYFNKLAGDFYLWVTQELDNSQIPKVKILYRIFEEDHRVLLFAIEEDF